MVTSALARTKLRTEILEDKGFKEVVREGKCKEPDRKLEEDGNRSIWSLTELEGPQALVWEPEAKATLEWEKQEKSKEKKMEVEVEVENGDKKKRREESLPEA